MGPRAGGTVVWRWPVGVVSVTEPSGWLVLVQPQAGVSFMTWWYSQYGASPVRLVRPVWANGVVWLRPGQAQTGWRARRVSVTRVPGSWRVVAASSTVPLAGSVRSRRQVPSV